ncbi:MAG: glutamine amidotransferase [Deltaproteobacteria bacterium]|nr:glutamine amidotransferase [Deltaproteobacteria bacterium]
MNKTFKENIDGALFSEATLAQALKIKPALICQCGLVPKRSGLNLEFGDMFALSSDLSPGQYLIIDATSPHELPKNPESFSAIMVSGSLSMVTDNHDWSIKLSKWLMGALNQNLPILGVCYGHQLLAQTLGGTVGYQPQGLKIGTLPISLKGEAKNHPLTSYLPDVFLANLAHSQAVLKIPPKAVILASAEHDPHQILAYGPKAVSLQFHPEFNQDVMEAFVSWAKSSQEAEIESEKKTPKKINFCLPLKPTPMATSLLSRFLKLALLT